jgi:UDP-glucose 4-epimerase
MYFHEEMDKKMKVVVTGGAGAIGFELAKSLRNKGCEVVIADNFIRSERDNIYVDFVKDDLVTEYEIDLSDYDQVTKLPLDVDFVYHMAAYNGTQNFYERPFDVVLNSTIPTINLLRHYSQSTSIKKFLYAGSSETYSSTVSVFSWDVPTDELVPLCIDNPLNPRWSYGGSKLHGELAVAAAGEQYGLPFLIARYHNVYGPRMGDKHVIPDFFSRAREGDYSLYGYQDTRSFLFISDAVRATIMLAESETDKEIVNIGGDIEIKILELGELMMRVISKNEKIKCFPSPNGSVRRRAPNIDKLKKLTGFEVKISLDEGLSLAADYYYYCRALG